MAKPNQPKPKEIKTLTTKPKSSSRSAPDKEKSQSSRLASLIAAAGHKLFLTLVAAVVIAAAVGAGALITYEVREIVWKTKYQNENRQQIVQMRIQLLERTIQLMSKSLAVEKSAKTSAKSSLKALARLGLDPGSIVDVITENLDRKTLAKCRFLESHSEYATLLRMDAIFFGDSTRFVIEQLMDLKPWWSADSTQREGLLLAMEHDFLSGHGPL